MGKIIKGILGLVALFFKAIFALIFIVILDHFIVGFLGGALVGLLKGGSGLFHMGLRSWGVSLLAKKG